MVPIRVADERSLKTKAAAEFLGVSPWTLREWAREGRIPCIRYSAGPRARMVFLKKDLEEHQDKHRQEAV